MFTQIPAKHEMVLLHVLDGMPGSHAYALVYGQDRGKATCEVNASRLLGSAKVQARKQELLAARAARQPMSAAFLAAEALAVAGESRALGQGSAAIAAYQLIAKLHGLLIDRQQTEVLVRKPSASPESPDEMSAEQWLGLISTVESSTSESTMLTIEHNLSESPEPSGEGST